MSDYEYDEGMELVERMLVSTASAPVPDAAASWATFAPLLPERPLSLAERFRGWIRRPLAIAVATSALSTGAAYAAGLEPHRVAATLLERVAVGIGVADDDTNRAAKTQAPEETEDSAAGSDDAERGDELDLDGFAASGNDDRERGSGSSGSGSDDDDDDRDDDDDNSGSGSDDDDRDDDDDERSGSDGDDDDDNSGSGSDDDDSGSGSDEDDDDDTSGSGSDDDDSGSGSDEDDDDDHSGSGSDGDGDHDSVDEETDDD